MSFPMFSGRPQPRIEPRDDDGRNPFLMREPESDVRLGNWIMLGGGIAAWALIGLVLWGMWS